jgi:hypothetical protein
VNTTFKIYGIKRIADEMEIQNFISDYFIDESEISYKDLLKWGSRLEEIQEYFDLIEKGANEDKKLLKNNVKFLGDILE